MGKLNALKVKTAGPEKHEDGDGLRLVVSPASAKKWVIRIIVGRQAPRDGTRELPCRVAR